MLWFQNISLCCSCCCKKMFVCNVFDFLLHALHYIQFSCKVSSYYSSVGLTLLSPQDTHFEIYLLSNPHLSLWLLASSLLDADKKKNIALTADSSMKLNSSYLPFSLYVHIKLYFAYVSLYMAHKKVFGFDPVNYKFRTSS